MRTADQPPMLLRNATGDDAAAVREIHLAAFPAGERELVARLAVDLLARASAPPTLSLLAEVDGAAVGHTAFSPVTAREDGRLLGYILAPLAVRPGHQGRGLGMRLVEEGVRRLSGPDAAILLVYGDPAYYGRLDFREEHARPYIPPHVLRHPFGWQGRFLGPTVARTSPTAIACVPSLDDPALW